MKLTVKDNFFIDRPIHLYAQNHFIPPNSLKSVLVNIGNNNLLLIGIPVFADICLYIATSISFPNQIAPQHMFTTNGTVTFHGNKFAWFQKLIRKTDNMTSQFAFLV